MNNKKENILLNSFAKAIPLSALACNVGWLIGEIMINNNTSATLPLILSVVGLICMFYVIIKRL